MKPYPIFLIGLADRRCVVVGGCAEAERKIRGLLECDAVPIVIAPNVTAQIEQWTAEGRVRRIARDFRSGDLRGAFLVIVSRPTPETISPIWEEAESEGALITALDDTAHCNCVAGSVVRKGPLTLSISTSGCAPALAVRLRERLDRELGPEYAAFLQLLGSLREALAARWPEASRRRRVWYSLVDSEALELLRAGREDEARRVVHAIAGIEEVAEVSRP